MSTSTIQASTDPVAETTPLLTSTSDRGVQTHHAATHPRRRSKLALSWFPNGAFGNGIPPNQARLTLLCLLPLIHCGLTLATTTSFDILRHLTCKFWYLINDSDNVPEELTDPRCQVPAVNSWFSTVIIIQSIWGAIGTFIAAAFIGKYAGKWGRKPLQTSVLLSSAFSMLCVPLSRFSTWTLAIWMVGDAITNLYVNNLLIFTVLADLTSPEERTKWYFFAIGLGSLGRAPAFAAGGLITSRTHAYLPVFYAASSVMFIVAVLHWLFMPETFGPEKREDLRRQHELENVNGGEPPKRGLAALGAQIKAPFYLLEKLMPHRDSVSGKRNYRLLILAISFLSGSWVLMYGQGLVVFSATKFHFGAKENGYMLSGTMTSEIIWLLILSPLLLKVMERFYRIRKGSIQLSDEDSEDGQDEERWKESMSARRDVHVVFLSYFIQAISQLCVAISQTGAQMIVSVTIIGFVGSGGPAMRSAAAASVPPLQSGEVIAAFELVSAIAQLLAPLQGVLMTVLINTAPEVVYFVNALVSLGAALLLLAVKEKDRYRGPSEISPTARRIS